MSPSDQAALEAVVRAPSSSQSSVLRAKIILALKTHQRLDKVAEILGVTINTVAKWRNRYIASGIVGLLDKHRTGRIATYGDETEKIILAKLGETPPDGCARWDGTLLSRELGIPAGAIWKILRKHGIQLSRMAPGA